MVGINEVLLAAAEIPFRGIKQSSMGARAAPSAIRDYLEPKYIKTRLT